MAKLFLFFKYNAALNKVFAYYLVNLRTKRTKPENIALNLLFGFVFGGWGGGPQTFPTMGLILHGTLYSLQKLLALSLQYTFTIKHLDDVQPS